jgi:hypothetical protein
MDRYPTTFFVDVCHASRDKALWCSFVASAVPLQKQITMLNRSNAITNAAEAISTSRQATAAQGFVGTCSTVQLLWHLLACNGEQSHPP